MESTLSPALTNIVGIVATAGGLALLWLLIKASSWVSEKIDSVRAFLEANRNDADYCSFFNTREVVIGMIQDVVDALNETFKKELIEKSADGKLSKEDGKKLLEKAIELVKAEISDNQKEILKTGIGDLEEWIRTKIENSVKNAKSDYKTLTLDNTIKSDLSSDDLDL